MSCSVHPTAWYEYDPRAHGSLPQRVTLLPESGGSAPRPTTRASTSSAACPAATASALARAGQVGPLARLSLLSRRVGGAGGVARLLPYRAR